MQETNQILRDDAFWFLYEFEEPGGGGGGGPDPLTKLWLKFWAAAEAPAVRVACGVKDV